MQFVRKLGLFQLNTRNQEKRIVSNSSLIVQTLQLLTFWKLHYLGQTLKQYLSKSQMIDQNCIHSIDYIRRVIQRLI